MFHKSTLYAVFSLVFSACVAYFIRHGVEPMRTIVFVIAALLSVDALIFLIKKVAKKAG